MDIGALRVKIAWEPQLHCRALLNLCFGHLNWENFNRYIKKMQDLDDRQHCFSTDSETVAKGQELAH